MSNKLTRALKSYVNKDTVMTMVNNIIGLLRGPAMLLLIPLYISPEMQGFWYTITSLSALTTFADLGFGALVGQFSAHEFAKIGFDGKMRFEGDTEVIYKIASLFRYVIKWALCVCIVAYPIILGVGIAVLNVHGSMSVWLQPWIIYMLSGGISFVARIAMSYFEGCGQIFKNQLNSTITSIVSVAVQVVLLVTNCGLYALSITSLVSCLCSLLILFVMYRNTLVQMYKTRNKINYHWSKNFLSLIWRYALSWASGYFIFQIYTPLAYMMYDPVLAGKVGITMTLVTAVYNISNTFTGVLAPRLNMSVSNRNYSGAKSLMKKGMVMTTSVYILGGIMVALLLGVVKGHWAFADKILDRFLNLSTVAIMLVAWLVQIPINSIAAYGRAHKQEPFLVPSIAVGLLTAGSTVLIAYLLPITYLFLGFAIVNVFSLGVFVYMYYTCQGKWKTKLEKQQDEIQQNIAAQLALEHDSDSVADNAMGDLPKLNKELDTSDNNQALLDVDKMPIEEFTAKPTEEEVEEVLDKKD